MPEYGDDTVYVVIGREVHSSHKHSEVWAVYDDASDARTYAKEMVDRGVLDRVFVLTRTAADRVR